MARGLSHRRAARALRVAVAVASFPLVAGCGFLVEVAFFDLFEDDDDGGGGDCLSIYQPGFEPRCSEKLQTTMVVGETRRLLVEVFGSKTETLAAPSLPDDLTVTFDPETIGGSGTSEMEVTATAEIEPGTKSFTVFAGGRQVEVEIEVLNANHFDDTIELAATTEAVYAVDCLQDRGPQRARLLEIDPESLLIRRTIADPVDPTPTTFNSPCPASVDVKDGFALVAVTGPDRLIEFELDSAVPSVIDDLPGTPSRVRYDPLVGGRAWVSIRDGQSGVLRYDLNQETRTQVITAANVDDFVNATVGGGELWLLRSGTQLERYSIDGSFLQSFGTTQPCTTIGPQGSLGPRLAYESANALVTSSLHRVAIAGGANTDLRNGQSAAGCNYAGEAIAAGSGEWFTAFSAGDGRTVLERVRSNTVTVDPLATLGTTAVAIAVGSAGTAVYAMGSTDDDVYRVAVPSGSVTTIVAGAWENVQDVAYRKGGDLIAADFGSPPLLRINATTGATSTVATGFSSADSLAVGSAGTFAYVLDTMSDTLSKVTLSDGTTQLLVSNLGDPQFVVLNESENLAFVGGTDGLDAIDLGTLERWRAHDGPVGHRATARPDGRILVDDGYSLFEIEWTDGWLGGYYPTRVRHLVESPDDHVVASDNSVFVSIGNEVEEWMIP